MAALPARACPVVERGLTLKIHSKLMQINRIHVVIKDNYLPIWNINKN